MSSWPKEDRKIWEKSEIMSEFESRILQNVVKAGSHLKESGLKEVGPALDAAKQKTDALNKSIQELQKSKDKLYNMSSDHLDNQPEEDDASDCAMCGMSNDARDEICSACYSKLDDSLARNEIIDSLKKMAKAAIDDKNTRLAYEIERTIQEIEDND